MARRVVRVVGDCLAPRLEPGDLLYVDEERRAAPGDVVVASLAGGATLIAELKTWEGRLWLTANRAEPIHVGGAVAIVGVADALLRQV